MLSDGYICIEVCDCVYVHIYTIHIPKRKLNKIYTFSLYWFYINKTYNKQFVRLSEQRMTRLLIHFGGTSENIVYHRYVYISIQFENVRFFYSFPSWWMSLKYIMCGCWDDTLSGCVYVYYVFVELRFGSIYVSSILASYVARHGHVEYTYIHMALFIQKAYLPRKANKKHNNLRDKTDWWEFRSWRKMHIFFIAREQTWKVFYSVLCVAVFLFFIF